MAETKTQSRKDPSGHVLRKGEGYRQDKKLYIFQYTDPIGRPVTLYANDLQELRQKEDAATADRLDNIQSYIAGKMTLNYGFDRYMSLKHNLRPTTKANYTYLYDRFVRESMGKMLLKDIRYSDVKYFYYQLLNEKGLNPLTLDNIHTLIHPVFTMGVRDGVIRINPASGVMSEIKKSRLWEKSNAKGSRHALTEEQGHAFLRYVGESGTYRHWLPMFLVFFGTGMRVGEVCGLRWEDINFEKHEISVNHIVVYVRSEDGCQLHISTPKTDSGIRIIPMMDDVYDVMKNEYQRQAAEGFEFNNVTLDGMTHFVFCNRSGNLYYQRTVNSAIARITDDYNDQETLLAAKEGREPLLLPHFSCHHIRHTFCTRMCENESNIKAIQEIMGHADVRTTMNIYAEATDTIKHEAIQSLQKGWEIY